MAPADVVRMGDEDPDMFDALVAEMYPAPEPAADPALEPGPVNDPVAIAAFFAR